jgi:Calcium-dependent channel, 7TM region, putative phosphate
MLRNCIKQLCFVRTAAKIIPLLLPLLLRVLLLTTTITDQCIAPFISAAGFIYFLLSEVIYKYQLLHVYWPLYESGGLYFYKLFRQVILLFEHDHLLLKGF